MGYTVLHKEKDPMGMLLLDYLSGVRDGELEVFSDDVDIWTMSARLMMRNYEEMSMLEKRALSLCRGTVLDAGAGSGCHTLALEKRGLTVEAIDISPGCVEAMRLRGVTHPRAQHLFALEKGKYDTILMLMNGLGLCGTLDGYRLFLGKLHSLLERGGQVVCDSTDVSLVLEEDISLSLEEYPGEVEFVMRYGKVVSDPFSWLYVDYLTLKTLAAAHGLYCERIMGMADGRYLATISRD